MQGRASPSAWSVNHHDLHFSKLIGKGSFGDVYCGKWQETVVAIKQLVPSRIVVAASVGKEDETGEAPFRCARDDCHYDFGCDRSLQSPNGALQHTHTCWFGWRHVFLSANLPAELCNSHKRTIMRMLKTACNLVAIDILKIRFCGPWPGTICGLPILLF